jgi:hypothetical protein
MNGGTRFEDEFGPYGGDGRNFGGRHHRPDSNHSYMSHLGLVTPQGDIDDNNHGDAKSLATGNQLLATST